MSLRLKRRQGGPQFPDGRQLRVGQFLYLLQNDFHGYGYAGDLVEPCHIFPMKMADQVRQLPTVGDLFGREVADLSN